MVRVMFFFWSGKIFLSINCLHGNEGFLFRTRSSAIHWQNVNSLLLSLYCLPMDDARIPRGSANPGGALTYYYRPQQSCGQGYIFTPVCHSLQRGGCLVWGWYPTRHWGRPPRPGTHPPGPDTPPPRPDTPPPSPLDQTHHPPDQTHTPQTRHPPGSRLRHTVYEWPVHILLECILVWHSFC